MCCDDNNALPSWFNRPLHKRLVVVHKAHLEVHGYIRCRRAKMRCSDVSNAFAASSETIKVRAFLFSRPSLISCMFRSLAACTHDLETRRHHSLAHNMVRSWGRQISIMCFFVVASLQARADIFGGVRCCAVSSSTSTVFLPLAYYYYNIIKSQDLHCRLRPLPAILLAHQAMLVRYLNP